MLFPGQVHYVAKNVFNVVVVVDPHDQSSVDIVKTILNLTYRNNAPFRVGFLFLTPPNTDSKTLDSAVAFARAFKYLTVKASPRRAANFVQAVHPT